MIRKAPGKIITFYSYKGGTGRSMALANVAWILASKGKRVLMVDWDFEAPGLHRYFHPFLTDKDLASSDGLLELVMRFEDAAVMPRTENQADSDAYSGAPAKSARGVVAGGEASRMTAVLLTEPEMPLSSAEPTGSDWYLPLAKLNGFTVPLTYSFASEGILDLLPAGRQGSNYAARVNSFNWSGFYDRLGGGVFLEAVKNNMRENYDYVLIDSRTGVSDTAGICTVQMPDILVVCFTFNIQSIEGAAAVAASIREQRRASSGRPVRIFPVPMRVEQHLGDKDRLNRAREFAESSFSTFLDHLDEPTARKYWGRSDVPYDPFYAFQEILSTVAERPGVIDSLLTAFERLTSFLTDGEITEQAELAPDERERIKQEFLRGAKPRSVRDVVCRNPTLQLLCEEITARQKAWEESKRDSIHLLNPLLVAQLQEAIELLVAMLDDNTFREFWEASRGSVRRHRLRISLLVQSTVILVLTIALILTTLWSFQIESQSLILWFLVMMIAGALGAVVESTYRVVWAVQNSPNWISQNVWLPFVFDLFNGMMFGLVTAWFFRSGFWDLSNYADFQWQQVFIGFLGGFFSRKLIPDFLEKLTVFAKRSETRSG